MQFNLRDQINASVPLSGVTMSWREGVPMRLEDLIRERVTLEWDRGDYEADAAPAPDEDAHPLATAGGWRRPKTCDEAIAFALEGFRRNAFFVTIDGRLVAALDTDIVLTPATTITFVRLLPLGGLGR